METLGLLLFDKSITNQFFLNIFKLITRLINNEYTQFNMEYRMRVYNFLRDGVMENVEDISLTRKCSSISQAADTIFGIFDAINQNNLIYN